MFQKIGPLKRCGINYTNLGESKGNADVEYMFQNDAYSAQKKFNFKPVKGVPIRIEILNGNKND